MNWEREYVLRQMIEENENMWKKLSVMPDKFFTNVQSTLYTINSQIKKIGELKELPEYEEECFHGFVIAFGNKDFLYLIAEIIMQEAEKDCNKTLLNLVNIVKLMAQFISLFEEYRRMFWNNREVMKPLLDTYISLYMLFTAAEIDLFQKVPLNECPFDNLHNWLRNPKAWNIQLAKAYKYGNT